MCGFVGEISKKKKIDKNIFEKCLNLISHRGPDSKKFFFISNYSINISMGFNRLSILDNHPRSDQPFEYKNLIIMFNGEIYNYKEHKIYLESKGYKFVTKSDTEVFAISFYHYGIECLKFFEGMFAFSVYNKKLNKFFFGRDHFGEKPLFYYHKNKEFYFSSEVSPLIKMIPNIQLNIKKMYEYLFYNYRVRFKNSESFFKDIKLLEPHTYIELDLNNLNLKKKKYWNLRISNKETRFDILQSEINDLLIRSIKNTLNFDQKFCFLMSGGLDSNTIISISKTLLNKNLNCYTFISPNKKYNEFDNVKKISEYLKLNSHSVKFPTNKDDNLNFLIEVISQRKSPLSTFTDIINNFLFKQISQDGYKVIISGNGSDEIFGGYISHFLMYLRTLKNNNDSDFKSSLKFWLHNNLKYIKNDNFRNYKKFLNSKNPLNFYYKNEFLNFSKLKCNQIFYKDIDKSNNDLKNLMYNDLFYNSVPLVCYEDDLNAMAYSMENRNPYLNKSLVEKVFSYNYKYLFNKNSSKSILRNISANTLPKFLLNQKNKYGLNCTFDDFLDTKSSNLRNIFLNNNEIMDSFVEKKYINNLLKSNKKNATENAFLFKYLNLIIFIENYKN